MCGKDLENYFIQSISASKGSLAVFFSRPIGLFIWVLIAISIWYSFYNARKLKKQKAAQQ